MHSLTLAGCGATPFGGYLKALGVLRLISEQADGEARGWWDGDVFRLDSELDEEGLLDFFLTRYSPTPILAPWNGGSGFYGEENGVNAIAGTTAERFAEFRGAIGVVRALPEVAAGKAGKPDEQAARRTAILKACRRMLCDRAIEWLDAAVGISVTDERAFAPVLGTGGNEGRLDYTNNFMQRIAALLIAPDKKTPVRDLLSNALFGADTGGLQDAAAGQFDPGRAGGANQGQGIEENSLTNPWDLVLTLEGAVAWASGLYRRQGVGYRSILCSPFTVGASAVGYGSAAQSDEARAEIWAPLWENPATYGEIKILLREGRADVSGRPAATGLQFAEAVCSLGIDRGIRRFVRYNLLKRRGDSYVALPAGIFQAEYRRHSDRIRELDAFIESFDKPQSCEGLVRSLHSAMFEAMLRDNTERMRAVMAALGRLIRRLALTGGKIPWRRLDANAWLEACRAAESPEVRIAAAVASMWDKDAGPLLENLIRDSKEFAWFGRDVPDRLASVLDRRIRAAMAKEAEGNPFRGRYELHPGDANRFIEGSTDDALIEDLLFAFCCADWRGFESIRPRREDAALPVYAVLKLLFVGREIDVNGERKRIKADPALVSMLRAGNIADAADRAISRLQAAGMAPLDVRYQGGPDSARLAGALLIPVWYGPLVRSAAFRQHEKEAYA